MAGPGGGSSGGGFGGGSFGGGGHSGGSFGGSHAGGSFGGGFGGTHHHRGGFSFGPTWGGRRGGCGSGCSTIFIVGFFILFAIFYMIAPSSTTGTEFGVVYDEATMQSYANEKYKEFFGSSEDNILLVLLTNEEADGYYTIAWVGDNINYEINSMFGEYSEYGKELANNINAYYAYSLDTDFARVIDAMAEHITKLSLDSSFVTGKATAEMKYEMQNLTVLELSENVINASLEGFCKKTGIPCVLVIDSAEKVFAEVTSENSTTKVIELDSIAGLLGPIAAVVALVAVVGVVGFIIFYKKKSKPKSDNNTPWEM